MRPVSPRFLAALRGSHTSRYRVRVLTTFQTGTDPSGTELDILTGSVTLDGTANERGSLDLTLDSQAGQRWPANQFGVLTPFGNELFVERGIAGLRPPPVADITELQAASGEFRDTTPQLTFTNPPMTGSLLVATVGGRGYSSSPMPAGFQVAVENWPGPDGQVAAVYWKIAAPGESNTITFGASGRGHAAIFEFASSNGWRDNPLLTMALGADGNSPRSSGTTAAVTTPSNLAVASFGSRQGSFLNRSYTNDFIERSYGHTGGGEGTEGGGSTAIRIFPSDAIPAGVIIGWTGTAASIPSGWHRVTALDSRFLKGVPNNSTDPGTSGGAATHSHTPTAHNHPIGSHTHSSGFVPDASDVALVDSGSGTNRASRLHAHTGTSPASTNNTGNATPTTGTASNDPPNLSTIWIASDGTPGGIPDGAVVWFNETTIPAGWTQHTAGNGRFCKGAAPSGDGGATAGSATHTHTGGAHTHTTTHSHPTSTSSGPTVLTTIQAGSSHFAATADHTHSITWGSTASGASGSANLAFSTDNHEPPFYTLALSENNSGGDLQTPGIIAAWLGALSDIPAGWVLCDGSNGTPNLLGRYIKNATTLSTDVGVTGGSTSHTHTGLSHSHSVPSHTHTRTYGVSGTGLSTGTAGTSNNSAESIHNHGGAGTSGSASGTTGNAAPDAPAENHEPEHTTVAFIMFTGAVSTGPAPSSGPVETELSWDAGNSAAVCGAVAVFAPATAPPDFDGTEYVPLGYFRIETVEQDDAPRSPIRITARDRMAAIIEARMLEPRTFAAGTTFREVFENLILEVYPNAVLDIDDAVASSTLREPATVEEDRYAFLRDMATSRGRIMFFDHRGVFVVAPEPDSSTPVFTVDEGQDGVLINLRRQLSRAGVYNAVVAEGTEADYDNDEPPARAVVFDDNPDSATYFFGPFGQVPRFYSSPLIFTNEQAELAAASILARTTGIPYTLDITAIPNPALEPFDPIRVIFEAGREEIHVIDAITIPLTSDQPMVISSRSLVQFIAGQEGS